MLVQKAWDVLAEREEAMAGRGDSRNSGVSQYYT